MNLPSIESRTTDTIAVLLVAAALFALLFALEAPIDTDVDWAITGGMLVIVNLLFVFRDFRWVLLHGWSYGPALRASHVLRLPISMAALFSSVLTIVVSFFAQGSTMLYLILIPMGFMFICMVWQPFNHLESSDFDWRSVAEGDERA